VLSGQYLQLDRTFYNSTTFDFQNRTTLPDQGNHILEIQLFKISYPIVSKKLPYTTGADLRGDAPRGT